MIESHPMNLMVDNGSNVTFNCVSFSYGPVTYTWLINGTTLDDNVYIINFIDDDDNNTYDTTLMILNVQLSDNGVYVCNATNREGTVSSYPATLSVIGKQIVMYSSNHMIFKANNASVSLVHTLYIII